MKLIFIHVVLFLLRTSKVDSFSSSASLRNRRHWMSLNWDLLLLAIGIADPDLSILAHLSLAALNEALEDVGSSIVVLVCVLKL